MDRKGVSAGSASFPSVTILFYLLTSLLLLILASVDAADPATQQKQEPRNQAPDQVVEQQVLQSAGNADAAKIGIVKRSPFYDSRSQEQRQVTADLSERKRPKLRSPYVTAIIMIIS